MTVPQRPLLRSLEMFPIRSGRERLHVLRDPEGFAKMVALPDEAALVALLMDGRRTVREIQAAFAEQVGARVAAAHIEAVAEKLERAYLLHGPRFERYRRRKLKDFLAAPVRPAAHAGGAYAEKADELFDELGEIFAEGRSAGSASRNGRAAHPAVLGGLLSPHIDPRRGGAAFAAAYRCLADASQADVFVVFGTAHQAMRQLFSVTRKDFATPLGLVPTDQKFIDRLAGHLESSVAGRTLDLFADELSHRLEHSIEFQALMLQYVLGINRTIRIVPILVGSFYEFIVDGMLPDESPEVQAMLAALRAAEEACAGRVCYVSGADLAHIGQRFGDEERLGPERLAQLTAEDRKLLERVAHGDPNGMFSCVAAVNDANRICGLAPTYMLLAAIAPSRGELLRYDQAAEPDGTACVSFAAAALYRE